MSAPVLTRGAGPRTQERPARIPTQRGAVEAPQQTAAQRAYARRDDRTRRLGGARPARTTAPPGRAQFVLLVMVLLGTALVATLWLSTAAAADSYRLRDARVAARALGEQSARLQRQVAEMVSPPALAQRATALGMVPVEDVARLVVQPDGAVQVVGEPTAAVAPPRAQPTGPATAPPADGSAAAAAVIGVGPGAPGATPEQAEDTEAAGTDDEQDTDAGTTEDTEETEETEGAGSADRSSSRSDGTDGTDRGRTIGRSETTDTGDGADTAAGTRSGSGTQRSDDADDPAGPSSGRTTAGTG